MCEMQVCLHLASSYFIVALHCISLTRFRCRRPLFRGSSVLSHAEGEGQTAFHRFSKPKETSQRDDVTCRQSLFVEPVSWMQSDIEQQQGKVSYQ